MEAKLPKWYREYVPALAKAEGSSGETYHRYLWLVMQSPLVKDIGLSGGSRSIFVFCALATNRQVDGMNPMAWMSSAKSSGFIPSIPTAGQFEVSPRGTLCYSSLIGGWIALPEYPVPAPKTFPPPPPPKRVDRFNPIEPPQISANLVQPLQQPQVSNNLVKLNQNPLQEQYNRVKSAIGHTPQLVEQLQKYAPSSKV